MTDTIDTINVPSLKLVEQSSAPAAPASGDQRLYIRTSDHHLVREDSSAVVTDIEAGGGGGGGSVPDYIEVRDEETAGTNGGTFTSGSWVPRVLNTEVSDTGGHCALASNQMTLGAGTYRVHSWAPAFAVAGHRLRLYNVTDSATLLLGSSTYAPGGIQTHAHLMGTFTIAGTKVIELQHRCETTQGTNGLGAGGSFAGVVEVFASIQLEKVA